MNSPLKKNIIDPIINHYTTKIVEFGHEELPNKQVIEIDH